MNNKIKTALLVLVLAAVLAGAAVAYPKLAGRVPEADPVPTPLTEPTAAEEDTACAVEDATEAEDAAAAAEEVYYAPDFTMLDRSGNEVRLSDLYDKPVILNFWATWCPPCMSELPHFDEAAKKYADSVNFVMCDLTDGARDTVESATAFTDEAGYTFPLYFDAKLEGSDALGVYSIPMTVMIRPDGAVAGGYIGAISAETLEDCVKTLTDG